MDISNTPAYSYVNDLSTTANDYGLLYNWYVVETDDVCPLAYRVPTISEIQTMDSFLGAKDAKLLKEKGFEFWEPPINYQQTLADLVDEEQDIE